MTSHSPPSSSSSSVVSSSIDKWLIETQQQYQQGRLYNPFLLFGSLQNGAEQDIWSPHKWTTRTSKDVSVDSMNSSLLSTTSASSSVSTPLTSSTSPTGNDLNYSKESIVDSELLSTSSTLSPVLPPPGFEHRFVSCLALHNNNNKDDTKLSLFLQPISTTATTFQSTSSSSSTILRNTSNNFQSTSLQPKIMVSLLTTPTPSLLTDYYYDDPLPTTSFSSSNYYLPPEDSSNFNSFRRQTRGSNKPRKTPSSNFNTNISTTYSSSMNNVIKSSNIKNSRDDPRSLIIGNGKEIKLTASKVSGLMQIQHRLIRLKRRANEGFGVVPVRDELTLLHCLVSSPEQQQQLQPWFSHIELHFPYPYSTLPYSIFPYFPYFYLVSCLNTVYLRFCICQTICT
jgi:hypothetical protein